MMVTTNVHAVIAAPSVVVEITIKKGRAILLCLNY